MMYNGYGFWGMDLIWWILWIVILVWIFAIPYDIPGQRHKKETPLDILKRRFASGEITKEDYQEHKRLLEENNN